MNWKNFIVIIKLLATLGIGIVTCAGAISYGSLTHETPYIVCAVVALIYVGYMVYTLIKPDITINNNN